MGKPRHRQVCIRCPENGKAIGLGVAVASTEELRKLTFGNVEVSCPWCGQRHPVRPGAAYLERLPGPGDARND